MSQLIEPSHITVLKDTDNISQDILDTLISDNIEEFYTSGYSKVSHNVHIYLKLDKPMYITKIEIYCPDIMPKLKTFYLSGSQNESFDTVTEIISGTRESTDAVYVPFETEENKIKKFQYYDLYFTSAYKPASAGSQYYVKYRAKIKIHGTYTIPGYLIKDTKENKYYTQKDNDIVMVSKDKLTEDSLMIDISEISKDNLDLINNPYRVLRILVP